MHFDIFVGILAVNSGPSKAIVKENLCCQVYFIHYRVFSTDIPSVCMTEKHVAVIGQSVTISADIKSCPPVEYVIWEKMNSSTDVFQEIDIIIDSEKYSESNMDHRNPQLVIKNVTMEDKVHYRLTVCNALGKLHSKNIVLKLKGGKNYTFSHKGQQYTSLF